MKLDDLVGNPMRRIKNFRRQIIMTAHTLAEQAL